MAEVAKTGGGRRGEFATDPLTGELAEVRSVQPYAAVKAYRCPGCNQEIAARTFHYVVVPLSDPAERRHWHRSCFEQRDRRPPGR